MSANLYRSWIKRLTEKLLVSRSRRRRGRHAETGTGLAGTKCRPTLEMLEVRVVPATITATPNVPIPVNASFVTITGSGFDATTPTSDNVFFSDSNSDNITGTVSAATTTSMTVAITGLSTVTPGEVLDASALIDNSQLAGPAAIGTVGGPTITPGSATLADSSSTITINGTGFSATPASNSVSFSNGVAGTVSAASTTQLTVTLATPPTALGSLTAIVTSSGFSSGAAVQVATEVSSTWTVTDSSTGSAGSLADVTLPYAVTHALNGDLINFSSSLNNSTIILSSGLTLTHSVTITGLGAANLAVSGNKGLEVFLVNAGVTATISNLTVENGLVNGNGGGIYNNGTLTLTNDAIANNTQTGASSGGGIYNRGTLNLTNSTVTGNAAVYGGGFANVGLMMVNDCTISGNSANSSAGGVENYGGTLTLSNSTIANNRVTLTSAIGGGIVNYPNTTPNVMTLTNDTIYGNSANDGGGIDNYGGTLTMSYDTVSGNYGSFQAGGLAVESGATTTLLNTIIAGNTAGTQDPNIGLQYGGTATITVADYDLFNNGVGLSITSGTGNVYSTNLGLVSSLGNYGGPTQTLALLPSSPAINAGGGTAVATDQRGIIRPATLDIGAFQLEVISPSTASLPVTATSLTINGSAFDPNSANDSVTFDNGVTGSVTAATPTSLTISISGLSTVTGGTALHAIVTVDNAVSSNVQVATAAPVVTANNANLAANAPSVIIAGLGFDPTAANDSVTFDNGVTGSVTGATSSSLTVSLTGLNLVPATTALHASVIVDGTTSGSTVQVGTVTPVVTTSASTIPDTSSTITINGAGFSTTGGNSVSFNLGLAGSITSASATQLIVTINSPPTALGSLSATIVSNGLSTGSVTVATEIPGNWIVTDSGSGAGNFTDITLPYAVTHALNGDLINFSSSLNNATITLTSGLTLTHSVTITGLGAANLAVSGNNLYQDFRVNAGVTASISSLTIENGKVSGSGAGVHNVGSLTLSNDTISGNTEAGSSNGFSSGGGVWSSGSLTVANSTVSGNSGFYGGGVVNEGTGVLMVTNTLITGNSGMNSAGGIENYGGMLTVSNSTITNNHTGGTGGGIANYSGTLTLTNDTIYGNTGLQGGGVGLYGGSMTLINDTIVGNSVTGYGGGVWIDSGGTAKLQNSIVVGNTSAGSGPDLSGTFAIADNDLIGTSTGYTFNSSAANIVSPSYLGLATLGNYGGPTQTIALLPGSPAVAAGNNSYVTASTDQRGIIRPATGLDIGAFQLEAITPSTASLPVTTTSLTINGSAFDPNSANDSVTFDNGVTGSITAATATSLTISLSGLSTVTGGTALHAIVTVDNAVSSNVQVATVAPVVTANNANLAANAPSVIITGLGFDPTTANDSVTFDNGVSGSVISANATSLTVSLTGLGSVTGSTALHASATVDGSSSGNAVEVATVIPAVTANTATLAVTATSLTIAGMGFDANFANDSVSFDNGVTGSVTGATISSLTVQLTGLSSVTGGTALHATVTSDGAISSSAQVATVVPVITASSVNLPANASSLIIVGLGFDPTSANDSVTFDNGVTGTVTAATATSLAVSLSGLSTVTGGTALHAIVTVDTAVSSNVQVATVAPVVTANSANLAANALSVVIAGLGFDPTTANDSVTFDNGVSGSVISANSTSLTVSLTGLGSVAGGTALHASATVDGTNSGNALEVAAVIPTVTANTANLADSSSTITINGAGFSSTPASDSVSFNLGVMGSVSAATASQLTVTITTPPTALGSLTAIVTTNTASSGATVQVANVVWDSVVTRLTPDSASNPEVGTLRYALAFANVQGGVPISFEPSLSGGTITLTSALTIGTNVTITGLGAANLAISGNNLVEVFQVNTGVTASISSLTVENGNVTAGVGGGIDNRGTLTLTNDTITGNSQAGSNGSYSSGGGIFNAGSLFLSNSTVSNNSAMYGGGFSNVGTMTVTNSTITNNVGHSSAGGVENYGGNLTLSNSTISFNHLTASTADGGGIVNYVNGPTTMTLTNDTIYGNSAFAGGGVENYGGTLTLSFDTVSGNYGSFDAGGLGTTNTGSVTLLDTIIAGNTAGTQEPNIASVGGPSAIIAVADYDLFNNSVGLSITSGTGNVYNTNPGLASSLGNYGGPTLTLALLPSSPAINAGGGTAVANDQRGIIRPATALDIGAFQLEAITPSTASLPVTATSLTINGSAFDPNSANDSVTFDNGVTGSITAATPTSLTISLSGLSTVTGGTALHAIVTVDNAVSSNVQVATVAPVVTANNANLAANAPSVIITGLGFDPTTANDSVTFDNGVTGSVISANAISLTVSLTGLGSVAGGTALHASATVDGTSSGNALEVAAVIPAVTANTANLADSSSTITINGAGFSSTPASDSVSFNLGVMGSVSAATASQLTVTITTPPTALGSLTAIVTTNTVSSGTTVQVANVVWDSVVTRLTSDSASNPEVGTLRYALVPANVQAGVPITFEPSLSGGTITLTSTLTIGTNVTITGLGAANLAISGNNLYQDIHVNTGVTASISSLTIENGHFAGSGGGIANYGTVTLSNDSITGNTAATPGTTGGGIFNAGSGTLTLSNSLVSGNSCEYSAGIGNQGVMTVTNTTISQNTATSSGAGIYNYGGTLTVSDSTIANNHSSQGLRGGGIVNLNNVATAHLTLINDTIYGNSGIGSGGGVANASGTLTLTNDTITGNKSQEGGGIASVNGQSTTVLNSIVAGNTGTLQDADAYGSFTANSDLIGSTSGAILSGTGNITNPGYLGLAALGNYGGPTQTFALLPGSPAIDAGNDSYVTVSTDQRGDTRIVNGTVDIGAFESQGFTIAIVSGNNQSTALSTAFNPLVVSVTANNPSEPVNGGQVTFAVTPASDGAGATLATSPATIGGGQASVTPTANAAGGAYTVTASDSGTSAAFTLKNAPTVTANSATLAANATSLSIAGFGFDANSANDSVTFDNGVTGSVTGATTSSLTVSLTGLSGVTGGTALHAVVTVDGAASNSVQVATTTSQAPTTTTLTDNGPNPSLSGTTVTFVVSVSSGTPISNEAVNIEDGSNGMVASPTLSNGTATFTLSSLIAGNHDLMAVYSGDTTNQGSQSSVLTQTVQSTFGLGNVTATPNGVVLTFNAPINPSTTVLYSSPGDTTLGAADVTVVGATTGSVRGSLVIDPTNPYMATFIKTGGLLAADTYTVTVGSAVEAVGGYAMSGATSTVTVASVTTPVLSVPSFARGPGQSVALTDSLGNATGIPVSITNPTDVTQASFTLTYDPTLLTIQSTGALTLSSVAQSADLEILSYNITTVDTNHDVLTAIITSSNPLVGLTGTGLTPLVTITASVPDSAPYLNKAVLNLGGVMVNNAPSVGVSGVDVAAYLGDVSGQGSISALGAALVDEVGSGAGTGFSTFKDLDPAIIGAVSGGVDVSATDASLINEAGSGASIAQIPSVPGGITPTFGGPDPYLYLSAVQASAGQTVTETLYLDVTDPNGVQLTALDEAIAFDAAELQVSNVRSAAGLAGIGSYGTASTADNSSGVLLVGQAFMGSGLPPVVPYGTDVAVLQFDVTLNADVAVGSVTGLTLLQGGTINGQTKYTAISDNEGALTWTPGMAPSNSGNAAVDGSVTVVTAVAPAAAAALVPTPPRPVVVAPKVVEPVRKVTTLQSTPVSQTVPVANISPVLPVVIAEAPTLAAETVVANGAMLSPSPVALLQPEAGVASSPATVSAGVVPEVAPLASVAQNLARSSDPGASLSLAALATNKVVPVPLSGTSTAKTSTNVLDELYRQLGTLLSTGQGNGWNLGVTSDGTSEDASDWWYLETIILDPDQAETR